MTDSVAAVLALHRQSDAPMTLFVDRLSPEISSVFAGAVDCACLDDAGLEPDELWACQGAESMRLVVLSAPRSARETFRVLSVAAPLVAHGGVIAIMPQGATIAGEVRAEATEIFLGVHPSWTREMLASGVVVLRKPAAALNAQVTTETRLSAPPSAAPVAAVDAGFGRRVVSLSIFGDSRFANEFWRNLPRFAVNYVLAHHALFPGWDLIIHHDEALYCANAGDVLHGLERRGLVRLVCMPTRPGQGKCERMLHRLRPAWNPDVEFVISRDVDGLPTWRDRCCVEEWVQSALRGETNAHTILDSMSHAGIMGGLCGFKASDLREMAPTFEAFVAAANFSDEKWSIQGADQDYLNSKVAPKMNVFEHCVFKAYLDDGVTRFYRKPNDWGNGRLSKRFAVDPAPPADDVRASVGEAVQRESDGLCGHMGAAGYDLDRARVFYDAHSPIAATVLEAEHAAGCHKNGVSK